MQRIVNTINFSVLSQLTQEDLTTQAKIGANLLATLERTPTDLRLVAQALWDTGSLFEYQTENYRQEKLLLPLILLGALAREVMNCTDDHQALLHLFDFYTFLMEPTDHWQGEVFEKYEHEFGAEDELPELPEGEDQKLGKMLQDLVVMFYTFIKAENLTPTGMTELYGEILEGYAACRLLDRELQYAIETEWFVRDRMGVLRRGPHPSMSDHAARLDDDGVDYVFGLAKSLLAQPGYLLAEQLAEATT